MITLENANLKMIIQGYQGALQWATSDRDDESLEDYDFSTEATDKINADCLKFYQDNLDLVLEILEVSDRNYDYSSIGHDFFLTRERHGAGFWDRGFGKLGDDITDICQTFGESFPYLGDDDLIYVS